MPNDICLFLCGICQQAPLGKLNSALDSAISLTLKLAGIAKCLQMLSLSPGAVRYLGNACALCTGLKPGLDCNQLFLTHSTAVVCTSIAPTWQAVALHVSGIACCICLHWWCLHCFLSLRCGVVFLARCGMLCHLGSLEGSLSV